MAEQKKKGLTFKELPGYCKAMRIVLAVLMLLAAIQMIVAAALTANNPYLWYLYMPAIGFVVPALVVGIVDLNIEKKLMAKREAEQAATPTPAEAKKAEPSKEEAPKAEAKDTWICPNCGAQMTGKFCHKCGTKKPEKVAAAAAPVAAKQEPVAAPAEEKKSKKGLIIGLSVGGGVLLLAGIVVGSVFGIKAIANSINGGGGGGGSGSKDYLPEDYVFEIPYGTASYETDDTLTGFVFYGDIDSYPELKNTVRVYNWCYSNYYHEYRYYELKYGTFTYTQSTQTIKVSIDSYQCYNSSWSTKYYEVPEQLTFKIKTTEKMVYSASNINDTVVKKVSYFTNTTSKKYSGE